jgi:hypothetical protein
MGQIAGYTVADYLLQHASRERRYARSPASTWDAIIAHITDPADASRLADSAARRLLYRYAIPLYQQVADAGDHIAATRLGYLLSRRAGVAELRARADAGDQIAAVVLADLLAERGKVEELRARADAGDWFAARRMAALLGQQEDVYKQPALLAEPELMAVLLVAPELMAVLQIFYADDQVAVGRLADRITELVDVEEALRAQADSGDWVAARRLADLLAQRGDVKAAEQILRSMAADGDLVAAGLLPGLLRKQGSEEEAERLRQFGLNPDGSIANG